MNTVLRLALAVVAAAALSACASHKSHLAGSQPVPAAQQQVSSDAQTYDMLYMAQVEYLARNRGVDVRWVNPPKKKKRADADRQ